MYVFYYSIITIMYVFALDMGLTQKYIIWFVF